MKKQILLSITASCLALGAFANAEEAKAEHERIWQKRLQLEQQKKKKRELKKQQRKARQQYKTRNRKKTTKL